MTPSTARVDMHCHSTASAVSKLGIQRALGLPECATPPDEVYEVAKRRGMDFVTITDHDTIAGALQLAGHPDTFVSEELTAWFRGEPQAVHVLCCGITPDDHDWLQRHAADVEAVADYLHGNEIACALAHPFYAVGAPLLPRHRRRLAQLFPIWEVRNGSRARELNAPAAVYIETHGGTGIGGSDDHAGVDIGRTWTETPAARTPEEFLLHVRAGDAGSGGEQGSAAKWAHAALGLASRVLGADGARTPDPMTVLKMIERVVSESDARRGALATDLGPDDARALLRAWLDAARLDLREDELLGYLQADGFSHTDLYRRARRAHERRLRAVVDKAMQAAENGTDARPIAFDLFEACVAAIPYAPAATFLGREKAKLVPRQEEPRRVALVADAVGAMHGMTRTLEEIRERGVPGYEVEVIGTDASVDRRLSAVAEVDVPFYPGLKVGVPGLPAVVETLAEGRYDIVHLCSPGPAGVAAALTARIMDLPVVGSYHTELGAYTKLRSGDQRLFEGMQAVQAALYGPARVVLSPSASADRSLAELGIAADRVARWERGVDVSRFGPARRGRLRLPGELNVLYAGRLTKEKGAALLVESFEAARARDRRLHLVLAGGGPEEAALRRRLGPHATFLGWLEGHALADAYASADVFLFCSQTDTYGQVILEAQASGLPVVAVAEGGPASLIEEGRTGVLCPPDPELLGAAVASLATSRRARARLASSALTAVRARTWERALAQLAAGYDAALLDERAAATEAEVRRAA
jgi:glycosyltransferase involved in cell wall biosynthesis/predicted metal-dependent phosphoesterase TrpH